MLKKLKERYEEIFARSESLDERLFAGVISVGMLVAIIGVIETFLVSDELWVLLAIPVLFLVIAFAALHVLRRKKVGAASVILGLMLNVCAFPIVFLYGGNITAGGPLWLALGIAYCFIAYRGVYLTIAVTVSIIVDIAVYYIAYRYPDKYVGMSSTKAMFMDSFFSVLTVGLVCGYMIRLQIKMFKIERDIADKQKKELEEAGKAKSKFFASVSHEIRTPINSIILLDEMILRKSDDRVAKGYAKDIKNVSRILLNFVNDILEFSQIENDRMDITPDVYDSREMIVEVTELLKARMQEKGLKFELRISPKIPSRLEGDKKRLQQVLINILNNAVKYTNEGKVTLTAHVDEIDDDNVRLIISVEDTGIGIKKENLENLYDFFKRVDMKTNQNVEGSGLGLAITKKLIDLMGGTISVDSIYKKGTIFTISVAQKKIGNMEIGDTIYEPSYEDNVYDRGYEAPEARILVVDDNKMNADLVAGIIRETKALVDVAYSGEECLKKTMNKRYDLILLDYNMPDDSGDQVAEKILHQTNGLCRESRIILASAESVSKMQKICEVHNLYGYLEKPIETDMLEQIIKEALPEELIELNNKSVSGDEELSFYTRGFYRKKNHVCITTDSIADISDEMIRRLKIRVIHLYVETEKGRFADKSEIDSDSISQYMAFDIKNAKVDSASVEEYEEFYSKILTMSENIIHISSASGIGKGYINAVNAAKGFEHVKVIDSESVSGGQALVTLLAAKYASEGKKLEEIIGLIEELKDNVESKILIPSIDNIMKTSYISNFGTNIVKRMKLHPVLGIKKSRLELEFAFSGKLEYAWRRFIALNLSGKKYIDDDVIYITHVGLSNSQLEFLKEEVRKHIDFKNIIIQKSSFSCGCNTGNLTIGIAYIKKQKKKEVTKEGVRRS